MGDQKIGLKVGRREFWQGAMARWQSSGLSVRRFCEGEGLCTASFYGWRRRLLGLFEGDSERRGRMDDQSRRSLHAPRTSEWR